MNTLLFCFETLTLMLLPYLLAAAPPAPSTTPTSPTPLPNQVTFLSPWPHTHLYTHWYLLQVLVNLSALIRTHTQISEKVTPPFEELVCAMFA